MLRISFRLLLVLFLTLPIAACDSGSDDDDDGGGSGNIGSATVTVTGGIQDSYNGSAFFSVDPDDGDIDFVLAIFDGTITTAGTGRLIAIGGMSDRPAVGEYPLNTGTSLYGGAYVDLTSQTNFVSVPATSGTLTIASSSSDRITGSLSFSGMSVSQTGSGGTATVEATFDAQFVDPDTAPNIPTARLDAVQE